MKKNITHQTELIKAAELLVESLKYWQTDDKNITRYYPAEQLIDKIDIALGNRGCTTDELIQHIKQYLHYTPDAGDVQFNKLLYSGIDSIAVLGDWLASVTNSTMHTYQMAPVATLMEMEIIRRLNQLIGFTEGDGIMVSGGTMANMIGMMLARYKKYPDVKRNGLSPHPSLVAYVSELSHYSYQKATNILGIGAENLVTIETDENGQLKMAALEQSISQTIDQGKQPFFIGLTTGTTILGSFDSIPEAAAIAKQHSLWLHVDGAWGGPAVFSKKINHLLAGSELADSFTWDAHKFMNMPVTTSLILVKDKSILEDCCSGGGGDYLFHSDENDAYNLGKKSLQCGRRADALKLWLSWKAKGSAQFTKRVDYLLDLKNYALTLIESTSKLNLLAPAAYLNILFRYEPNYEISNENLAHLNTQICKTMMREDLGFVDYAHYKGKLGIRYILANDKLDRGYVELFLKRCEDIGNKLCQNVISR